MNVLFKVAEHLHTDSAAIGHLRGIWNHCSATLMFEAPSTALG